jgi:hypothetical protein
MISAVTARHNAPSEGNDFVRHDVSVKIGDIVYVTQTQGGRNLGDLSKRTRLASSTDSVQFPNTACPRLRVVAPALLSGIRSFDAKSTACSVGLVFGP